MSPHFRWTLIVLFCSAGATYLIMQALFDLTLRCLGVVAR